LLSEQKKTIKAAKHFRGFILGKSIVSVVLFESSNIPSCVFFQTRE